MPHQQPWCGVTFEQENRLANVLVGSAVAAMVISKAPAHKHDDLSCQSYCFHHMPCGECSARRLSQSRTVDIFGIMCSCSFTCDAVAVNIKVSKYRTEATAESGEGAHVLL